MKYGRFNLAGIATSWVVQALVGRAASHNVARIVAMSVLTMWVIVVDFFYRKEQQKRGAHDGLSMAPRPATPPAP